ncbi:hypothetical protein SAMN02745135_00070 [Caloranaerobacter azorensis DSM 13643]|uniref:Uncharacterized protein n=1 Tax=Caloranaerobacter azorensis DSM 13643 TaxID=1121264 RepID=A0A1M5R3I1_9FIRM|nr:hypothetical protein [Caloranaerobacter azorensis]SHH20985.1 hypothetical protein SAMN02745135_00070 [Caloranaerobacter azorensis DSM 13643]
MKYEKPIMSILEDEEVCNEMYSSGIVLAAALAIAIVALTPKPAH